MHVIFFCFLNCLELLCIVYVVLLHFWYMYPHCLLSPPSYPLVFSIIVEVFMFLKVRISSFVVFGSIKHHFHFQRAGNTSIRVYLWLWYEYCHSSRNCVEYILGTVHYLLTGILLNLLQRILEIFFIGTYTYITYVYEVDYMY